MAQSLRLYEQRIGYTPKSLLPITKMKKKKRQDKHYKPQSKDKMSYYMTNKRCR